MKIYIIRHGETQANKEGLFQGWTDHPLNELGVRLAQVTGRNLKPIRFDACFSSPLQRARQTAQLVLTESGNGDIPIRTDDRLKEIYAGEWEGKCFLPGKREVDDTACRQFYENPFHFPGCPGGENAFQVCKRTQAFLKELAAGKLTGEELPPDGDGNVLVAIHGFAVRAMLNFLFEDPSDFWQGNVPYNCSVSIVEVHDGIIKLTARDQIYYDPEDCIDRFANL